ncbi:MAG: hypothetical protein JWL87_194 [Candidatus Adlerbacteria bacterium]|nr:hypothetical protein [Candidatus Adlerbacteria bacterium]
MKQQDTGDRRRLVAEAAQKQLTDGTWPQVMKVFGYQNPKAPRVPDEEFARLKALYEQAACPNLAAFVDLVRFKEKERDVTMSFNLSLRLRLASGADNAALILSSPDIMVGTRYGIEGAAVWLKNFFEAVPDSAPESVQLMDKIFGEAVEFLQGTPRQATLEDMVKFAITGEGDIFEPADKPLKH